MTLLELRDRALELYDQYLTEDGCSRKTVQEVYQAIALQLKANCSQCKNTEGFDSVMTSFYHLGRILRHEYRGTLIMEPGVALHFQGTAGKYSTKWEDRYLK